MERNFQPRNGESPPAPAGDRAAWWLVLAGLLAWQGWMTLGLFGGDRPWERLTDEQPILSGRHPLHLYHGYLGARALLEHGTLSCYDPNFHAGYPKTPVFDSGSRPAELMLALIGGSYRPAAYKIGVALIWAIVPLLLFVAGRGVGMGRGVASLACVLGQLVWWSQPGRDALEAGDVDLLLAAILALTQAGLLIRFHREPGLCNWLGVVAASLLAWFAHPLLMAVTLPLFLVYYLSVGARHRLAWHFALLGGLLASLGVNGFWLVDWIGYWWIRVPASLEASSLPEASLETIWDAPALGGAVDKGLACVLVIAAAAGVWRYNQTGQRATARVLGLAGIGFSALAAAGLFWEPLGRLGAARLLVPALLFAALPAAHALGEGLRLAGRWRASRWAAVAVATAAALWFWRSPPPLLAEWASRLRGSPPLQLGLDSDQQHLLETIREQTTPDARILWEDHRVAPRSAHWTALLPLLTAREYVGGLDPEAGIEHTANGLSDGILLGKPVSEWREDMLREYCRRYNIGWVVCWSPAACARFRAWDRAELTATLPPAVEGGSPGCLFALRRSHSFALIGSAQWLGADTQRIILGDVTPPRRESGGKEVLLSLHYQAGMRVAPSRVLIGSYRPEKPGWPPDATPLFVRLRVDYPVTRVTITWDKR